jgi:5'-nucleotidase/UDP-sugar diphosphatase
MKKQFTIFAAILIALFSTSMYAENISIVYFSDSHSCLSPGGPRDGELKGEIGGIAKAASIIMETKMTAENSLILHGGDVFTGDLFFNKYFGVAEFQMLLALGLDAMTLGNHEFDLTPDILTMVLTESFAQGSFPILSANYDDNDLESLQTLSSFISSSLIKEFGDVKIGLFGMTSPETNITSFPSPAYISEEIPNFVVEQVTALREAGCHMVIMMSHLGFSIDQQIAYAIPGIDLILGAHDHFAFEEPILIDASGYPTRIVHCGAFYRSLGTINMEVTTDGLQSFDYELVELNENIPDLEPIKEQIDMLIADIEGTYGAMYSQQVGFVTEELSEVATDLLVPGYHDTDVGNLVCDAFLAAFEEADISVQAGGLTANPLYQGPIVGSDIYRMISYGFNEVNTLGYRMTTFDVTGGVLYEGIMFGLQDIAHNDEFLIQVGGMDYTYEIDYVESDPSKSTITDLKINIGGVPIDMEATYTIATNEFIAGFFQYLGFTIENLQVYDVTEFMVTLDYIAQVQVLSPYEKSRVYCDATSNVKEVKEQHRDFNIFPNPCNNSVNIELEEAGRFEVLIIDMKGEIWNSELEIDDGLKGNSLSFDTSVLPNGKYYAILKSDEVKYVEHFIVSK